MPLTPAPTWGQPCGQTFDNFFARLFVLKSAGQHTCDRVAKPANSPAQGVGLGRASSLCVETTVHLGAAPSAAIDIARLYLVRCEASDASLCGQRQQPSRWQGMPASEHAACPSARCRHTLDVVGAAPPLQRLRQGAAAHAADAGRVAALSSVSAARPPRPAVALPQPPIQRGLQMESLSLLGGPAKYPAARAQLRGSGGSQRRRGAAAVDAVGAASGVGQEGGRPCQHC